MKIPDFKDRSVWVCGNGGSASNAEHFTNDLFKVGIKAHCLNSNVSLMTMVANDYGYEFIFSKQVERFAQPGDLLVTISCSGKSKNVVNAIRSAKKGKVEVFNFPTFKTKRKHSFKEYGVLENEHLELIHKIASSI